MCVFVHMSVSECVFCFPMAFIKWKQEGNIFKKNALPENTLAKRTNAGWGRAEKESGKERKKW